MAWVPPTYDMDRFMNGTPEEQDAAIVRMLAGFERSWNPIRDLRRFTNRFKNKDSKMAKHNCMDFFEIGAGCSVCNRSGGRSELLEFSENMTLNVTVKFELQNKYGATSEGGDSHQISYFVNSKKEAADIILRSKKAIQSI